jgi:hypothetical protein
MRHGHDSGLTLAHFCNEKGPAGEVYVKHEPDERSQASNHKEPDCGVRRQKPDFDHSSLVSVSDERPENEEARPMMIFPHFFD